jgi:hypothetical protein
MVSMVEAGALNDNDLSMDAVVPKTEPAQDGHGSMSSSVSTPEPEEQPLAQDAAQTQKRKGGRKPVCFLYNLGFFFFFFFVSAQG